MHKGHRTELGCREEPILTPCWNCFFDLLFVAFVTIIIHTDLPQRTLSLFLTVKLKYQASQWLRIPKQRTLVWCLIQEDPMCPGATKLVHHYWASTYSRAHEPQLLSPHSITTEVQVPMPSPYFTTRETTAVKSPGTTTKSSPCLLQLEKAHVQQWRLTTAKKLK